MLVDQVSVASKKMPRPNKCADERSSHQIIISLQNVRKISNVRGGGAAGQ